MTFTKITSDFFVADQINGADVVAADVAGFKSIICTRPDGEESAQPPASEIEKLANTFNMAFAHIPVSPGAFGESEIFRMRAALDKMPGPVLAYCRSGTRAVNLWALAEGGRRAPNEIVSLASKAGFDISAQKARLMKSDPESERRGARTRIFDVVIVGGGSAGIATASSLLKRRRSLDIAIIEPAEFHYYQPGWTMVGAGVFQAESTRVRMSDVMPSRVTWIKQAASGFAPESKEVVLGDGSAVRYRILIAAPGLKLAWDAVPGLSDALGRNGVTSNYRYELAPYTYKLANTIRSGRALFTQPAMPIKCAGAPQKAMYLSCDIWRSAGALPHMQVEFHNAGAVLFGVQTYVPALMEYVESYGIDLQFESRLVEVNGSTRVATFEHKSADGAVERVEREFDMLHAVPPQLPLDFMAESPLAGTGGWVDVDPATLRHTRYPDIFGVGDATSTPNAKTAAAARKQAPVAAFNALAALDGHAPVAQYNGYGSCPLTVERGKIVLAEFGYGGKLLPTFPRWLLDGTRPTRAAWFLKDRVLPPIYWHAMLKGREWLCEPEAIERSVQSGTV